MEYVLYLFGLSAVTTILFVIIMAKSRPKTAWIGKISDYTIETLFISSALVSTICWAIVLVCGTMYVFSGIEKILSLI